MYSVHDWAEVHRLHERQGLSKTAIARRLAMSRNTVDRLLSLEEPPGYQRGSKSSLSDPFKADISEMLDDDAEVPSTVILERLQERGYGGRITILKDYLKEERPRFLARRTYQRTSYVPGEIGQFDWWSLPLAIPVGKNRFRKPHGLVATLPHSAAHATVFTFTKAMGDFCPAFVSTLERLGGVPEAGVFNNDSSIVATGSGKKAVLHDEVAALFGHVRLKPIILEKERPESNQCRGGVGHRGAGFRTRLSLARGTLREDAPTGGQPVGRIDLLAPLASPLRSAALLRAGGSRVPAPPCSPHGLAPSRDLGSQPGHGASCGGSSLLGEGGHAQGGACDLRLAADAVARSLLSRLLLGGDGRPFTTWSASAGRASIASRITSPRESAEASAPTIRSMPLTTLRSRIRRSLRRHQRSSPAHLSN